MSAIPSFPPDLESVFTMSYAHCIRGNGNTFRMPVVKALLQKYITPDSIVVDPFCGESTLAQYRNDLAQSGKTATEWLDGLIAARTPADVVLLDPPYSPRQIKDCYKGVGLEISMTTTQNARLYKEARERLDKILRHGGIAISFGWNSTGFGKKYGYRPIELLVINHGAARNDTLVKVERKP